MARNTEVILRQEVPDLGHAGDVVEVAPGYARNYLLPRGLAYRATEANKHRVDQEKEKYMERLEREKIAAEARAETMVGLELTFEEYASEEDRLYGSVSSSDIADRLEREGHPVDSRQVGLDEPIKSLGEFEVPIRLHPEVVTAVRVTVSRREQA